VDDRARIVKMVGQFVHHGEKILYFIQCCVVWSTKHYPCDNQNTCPLYWIL